MRELGEGLSDYEKKIQLALKLWPSSQGITFLSITIAPFHWQRIESAQDAKLFSHSFWKIISFIEETNREEIGCCQSISLWDDLDDS